MQAAEVIKGSRRVERKAELVFGVERWRSERARHSHHVVWDIVAILPNHGAADRDADGVGLECKVVDRDLSLNRVGGRGIKNATRRYACCTGTKTLTDQGHDVDLLDVVVRRVAKPTTRNLFRGQRHVGSSFTPLRAQCP